MLDTGVKVLINGRIESVTAMAGTRFSLEVTRLEVGIKLEP